MIAHTINYIALLLAADPAGGGSILSNPEVWRVINLLLFLVFIVYVLRKKIGIGQIFDNRGDSIRKQLEQARTEKQEALAQLHEVEARLARLDQEVAAIRNETETEAAREAGRIQETAIADAEKIRQMAAREIEGAMKSARKELREFVAERSVDLAESIIKREIRPEDGSRIFSRYVDELHEVNK